MPASRITSARIRSGMRACAVRAMLLAVIPLCAPSPAAALKSGPVRKVPVELIVIHSTGGPTCDDRGRPIWVAGGELAEDLRTIEAHPKLGIHYMIARDGQVVASIPEDRVAYHVFRYSQRSIGIELINDGDGVEPFPAPQIDALVKLLRSLGERYGIGAAGIRRHSDLDHGRMACAPGRPRKVDPGAAFPYQEVLRRVQAAR